MMPLKQVDLSKKLLPLSWCVEGLILRGYINTIASLPGEGKTALLTGLAWQMSRPEGEFLGRAVQAGVSIYVDFDAPGEGRTVRYWLAKHKQAFPDGDETKIRILEPDNETYGLAETELTELTDLAKSTRAKLILIDAFSSAFPHIDPNKLVQVQSPLWFLRKLAHETEAAVVLIDHLPKPVSGERVGARGIMGSIAKSAQARSVHILSRIKTANKNETLLRWDTSKMSYSARPEPFAVSLEFSQNKVSIGAIPLPEGQGETRTERAVRALQDYLEARRGESIPHQLLLDLAMEEGNLRRRAASEALRQVKHQYGDELETLILPGRGKPQGYCLKPLDRTASLHQIAEMQSETENHLLHDPLHQSSLTAPKEGET